MQILSSAFWRFKRVKYLKVHALKSVILWRRVRFVLPFKCMPYILHTCVRLRGGAMVLAKLPVPGRPTIWMIVGQGPYSFAVGAGGGCLDIFSLSSIFSHLFLPLSGRRPVID